MIKKLIGYILLLAALTTTNTTLGQTPLLDSLKLLLKTPLHDTTRCKIHVIIVEEEYNYNIWPIYNAELKAIAQKNLALNPSEKLKKIYTKFLTDAINNEGFLMSEQGNYNQALQKYFQCLGVQEKNNDNAGAATTINNIAFVYQHQGNITKALEYFEKSSRMYQTEHDQSGIARVLNNIGSIYDDQGDIPKALEYYHKSLQIREKTKDIAGTASCLNNIGIVYHKQGDLEKAIEFYTKSVSKHLEIKDLIGAANSQNNLGAVLESKADKFTNAGKYNAADSLLDIAITQLEKTLHIYSTNEIKNGEAGTLSTIGSVYKKKALIFSFGGNDRKKDSLIDLSLNFYQRSLKLRQEIQDKKGEAYSLYNIATALYEKKDHKQSFISAQNSLKIAQNLGFPDIIKSSSQFLSNLYNQKGDFKNALLMHQLFKQMSDSLLNESSRKAAIQKSFQFVYEKKSATDSLKMADERDLFLLERKQDRTQKLALYGGLALVVIFSAFMVNRFIVTNRQKKVIEHKEREALIQNIVITEQKHLVEEKQKEILDSIHYAKRIQSALIANGKFINEHLPENFVYFNPKDIVSGDFYWASLHNNKFYLAICDSTGHGVPGGFMSLLNMGFLSEAIKEKDIEKPNEIFNYVRDRLISSISSEGQKDGMDGILLCYDKKKKTFEYAAANNEPILIRDGNIIELPKDKMPVGKGEKTDSFTNHELDLKPGDQLFLYTDGYADQFGGPKGKKFMYKRLNEFLLSLNNTPLPEQKQALERNFNDWKNALEQVDDVLIAGIKI